MAVDTGTVRRIAMLARLNVPEDELDGLAGELNKILDWMELLNGADTDGVAPMTAVKPMPLRQPRGRGDRGRDRRRPRRQRAGGGGRVLHRPQGHRVMADDALTDLTIAEARDRLGGGEISARELAEAHIAAIEGARALNAFVTETPERAIADAEASDAKRRRGEAGALEGIPLGIKDLFCTEGVMSTAASGILNGFVPTYESTVSRNLLDAGAVMLGKLNLDEFAMGSSNETSHFGPVENPWRREGDNRALVPGGSSGGSGAAVAARLCLGATGTDTGGSIRQPAAFCGVVGAKPTYGRCSRWGIVAFASSLDQAGPMARSVRDTALMLGAMAGFDPKDSTSVDIDVPDFEAALEDGVAGLKVGIPAEYSLDETPDDIRALWDEGIAWLRDAGAEPVEVSLPHTAFALPPIT